MKVVLSYSSVAVTYLSIALPGCHGLSGLNHTTYGTLISYIVYVIYANAFNSVYVCIWLASLIRVWFAGLPIVKYSQSTALPRGFAAASQAGQSTKRPVRAAASQAGQSTARPVRVAALQAQSAERPVRAAALQAQRTERPVRVRQLVHFPAEEIGGMGRNKPASGLVENKAYAANTASYIQVREPA